MAGTKPIPTDLNGKVFGRLTVIRFLERRNYLPYWLCRCACGREVVVRVCYLKSGHTKSCRCLRKDKTREMKTKHARYGTPEYKVWSGIKRRCFNPHESTYYKYGGRGITVCARWRDSFADFLADMGPKPSAKHSIGRINNNGPYSPENCCWETLRQQARNKRNNHLVTFQGKTFCIAEWAEILNIREGTLSYRLRQGWSVERALTQPCRKTH